MLNLAHTGAARKPFRPNNSVPRSTLRLAYALKAFLETCERDFCSTWPVQTPGLPRHWAEAALEYRNERKRTA